MESIFKEVVSKLKEGSMSMDSAIQWMREAKIIDNVKLTEEKAREAFQHAGDKIDFAKFEEGLKKIADESKQGVEEMHRKLKAVNPQMDSIAQEVLSKLKEGSMSLDSAIQWMREAKIIDNVKLTEEKAREAFQHAGDKIDFAKFEEGLKKIAEESKQGVEEMHRKLEAVKPQIDSIAQAGISAIGAINKALEDVKKK